MTVDEKIEHFKHLGYTEEHKFPGEYTLLINGKLDCVRVYEDGSVWIKEGWRYNQVYEA